jgi:hypothetical protein
MENLITFESFNLNEDSVNENQAPEWKEDGIVLIRGVLQENGKKYLYASKLIKVALAASGKYQKAYLKDEIYRIGKDAEGKYVAKSVQPEKSYIERNIGLLGRTISLNSKHGKTPIWWETIKETNFFRLLRDHKETLDDWKDITW